MYNLEELIPNFPGREESLQQVKRFRRLPMCYRTNLDDHQRMVYWMTQELLEITAKKSYVEVNELEALTLAIVHDDAEMITGDLQYGDRLLMSEDEIERHENGERKAIESLVERYGDKVNGFSYGTMLSQALHKDTVVGQFVSYADKLVGFGESWHELYAGNKNFLIDLMIGNTPTLTYIDIFKNRKNKWPLLTEIFQQNNPLLNLPGKTDVVKITAEGKPHTKESLGLKTGNGIYDCYKEVLLRRGRERGKKILLEPEEESSELSWRGMEKAINTLYQESKYKHNIRHLLTHLQPFLGQE